MTIEVRLRTDGKTKLHISDDTSAMKQTREFTTILQALEWVKDQIR